MAHAIIPGCRKLKQEDGKFETSLGYIAKLCLNVPTRYKKEKREEERKKKEKERQLRIVLGDREGHVVIEELSGQHYHVLRMPYEITFKAW